jgi:hypothetical protein
MQRWCRTQQQLGAEEENIVSNVVDLLEKIGQSSRLQSLSGEQLAHELAQAGIEPAVQAAIVQQRPRQLEQLLGANSNVCCLVHAPQDDEPDQQQPDDDKKITGSAQSGADRRVARAG